MKTVEKASVSLALLMATVTALSGCQRDVDDEPLKVSGHVFVFNYRVARSTYLVTLAKEAPLPNDSFVEARFENPAGGAPLVTRSKIFPLWDKVSLESPPVHCVVKDRPYAVSIRILDGQNTLIQQIETTVTSTLDQSVLPTKPLVVGPVYTPNPEVYRPDGSADYGAETGCPGTASKG
ncbi:hypothetical protein [Rhizobium sp. CECT 9324]|uniref:hypothetical protein n=1 Tax=Rhizobium sp. CECT 9324 TaxID=2845820 RepID=UPI001E2DE1A7|nr:hypothetical protein [Rhizobium sp. CECT 9324]CAH0340231.1 hypothetical protein RHI9324_01888 [Rhizobium sp. CECT 9324]